MSKKFSIGDKVRFKGRKAGDGVPNYDTDGDHIIHGGTRLGSSYDDEGAEVVTYWRQYIGVKYTDSNGRKVCLNFEEHDLELISTKEELKNDNMDIDYIKGLDKSVLKEAKKNVLEARKQEQTQQAEAFLTELFSMKDAIEEKIGQDQDILKRVSEDIKVFDVK